MKRGKSHGKGGGAEEQQLTQVMLTLIQKGLDSV